MPPGGIRTHNPSRRAASDLRLGSRDHWDRQTYETYTAIIGLPEHVVFFVHHFSLPLFALYIYIHILMFHLYHSVNIYSNWLREQFSNLSLYTLYIVSVQYISLKKYVCVYMYIYVHICIYTYMYIYIYICIYTHTHTHTHIHVYMNYDDISQRKHTESSRLQMAAG